MFTGIVTDVGRLLKADDRNDGRQLRIGTRYEPASIELGASITVDGICLTVTDKGDGTEGNWFEVFAALETLSVTKVGKWSVGRRVNLERSLKIGDELGGHIVSGHIDGMAVIVRREATSDQLALTFETAPEIARFIAKKGSVALNGTSLTVNSVEGNRFGVHLIPYTVEVTSWGDYQVGDHVNIEVDPMARYAARLSEAAGAPVAASTTEPTRNRPVSKAPHILVIEARFYDDMADELFRGAEEALKEAGATYDRVSVPGALEIPAVIAFALKSAKKGTTAPYAPAYDGFVALGTVIRGETTHYDIVSEQSARALMDLAVEHELALGNGILTVENDDQAWARIKVDQMNKGGGAAKAALAMVALKRQFGL
ncbi:MAG TPA: riboflavin synthase [Devosiaceae bacterium]|nr:riboflavin synthase [Devosiaceae bacterium]